MISVSDSGNSTIHADFYDLIEYLSTISFTVLSQIHNKTKKMKKFSLLAAEVETLNSNGCSTRHEPMFHQK